MRKHRRGQPFDVLGDDVFPALQGGIRLRSLIERQRTAGRYAADKAVLCAGGFHDVHKVVLDLLGYLDLPVSRADVCGLLGSDDGLQLVQHGLGRGAGEHLQLLLPGHIAQRQPHEKTVHLGIWQREGAKGFQRILGGQHHKGLSQAAGHAVHGNLPFLHGFQQGRLGTGRGTVDLVRQHKVGEERAGPELELTGLLVVEIDAGQIGGQQVGRELHPFEVPAHRARKCTQEHGFAGAGLIFQQYMASAEEADQNFLGSILLAHNDAGTVGHNFFAVGGKSGSVHWCFLSQKQFF